MWAKIKAAWQRIKKLCLNSLTVAVTYIITAFGALLQSVDLLANALNDPTVAEKVKGLVGTDTKALGIWMTIVGAVTLVARLRSILKKQD